MKIASFFDSKNRSSRFLRLVTAFCSVLPLCAQNAPLGPDQHPAISYADDYLPITQSECLSRAKQAYATLGYSAAPISGGYLANQSIHNSYILCRDGCNGQTLATIFVASNATDGGVPGYQRVQLENLMRSPGGTNRPPASTAGACGVWNWFNGFTVTLNANGTQTDSNGGRGTWSVQNDGRVRLHWDSYNSNDILTLSADGNTLTGTYNGQQARSTRRAPCPSSSPGPGPSPASGGACGVWNWFNGFSVTLNANGTQSDSNGGHGTWWIQNDGRVHLYWDSYSSNDVLTLSGDGNTLTGSYNGQQARSTRRAPCASPGTSTRQQPGGGDLCLTPKVQNCIEQWISLAMGLLNGYNGSPEFNRRKPWSINRYGILQGGGPAGPGSAFAPDNFPQYHNNKYCYMMGTYPSTPDSPEARAAGVPVLQPYVLSCAAK